MRDFTGSAIFILAREQCETVAKITEWDKAGQDNEIDTAAKQQHQQPGTPGNVAKSNQQGFNVAHSDTESLVDALMRSAKSGRLR